MTPQDYTERKLELESWEVNLTSYRLGDVFYAKVDNVSPGATVARSRGASLEEAVNKALAKARERLANTRRRAV
ncbi:MAG TPA: hypothetical protein VKV15_03805 [Bryobacteraceae bacterium]|nr:hypothetical protein [Bryobacteraceae bacterium]